jgi:uncharacterized protein (DUF433 family)/predicted RNA-binding protein with PUA-like domain
MRFWIFKCNPKTYRLKDRLADPKPSIDWRVPQYSGDIGPGDIAFLWQGGSKPGILGVMLIETEPKELADSEIDKRFYVDPNSVEAKRIARTQLRVAGTLIHRNLDLRMKVLKDVLGLENLSAFKPTIGTVFPVTAEEGAILARHAGVPPLRVDEGGVLRVGKSRISLDLIVEQYENGMTPEDMVRAYDTLVLADVHAVIAYYLRHREEVRAYLKRRAEEAEALRARIEAERPRISREELLARRRAGEKADAAAGQ